MTEENEQLPPYKIEGARSARSKCKTCKRKIDKDILRIGVLIEGPFGTGYMWHHLTCAAKRRIEDVEGAYEEKAWPEGVEVPPIEELRKLAEKATEAKAKKKETPYAELAPTGRSKCKHSGDMIEKGTFRIVLSREVEFYGQTRSGPINVKPECVAAELMAEDCATEIDGFASALRLNSGIEDNLIDKALEQIGELPG